MTATTECDGCGMVRLIYIFPTFTICEKCAMKAMNAIREVKP